MPPRAQTLDVQILHTSTYLASLVLEFERCRTVAPPARPIRDGMIPLVGSSKAISALRERITHIAATDFTVMVEGASGPHPHPI